MPSLLARPIDNQSQGLTNHRLPHCRPPTPHQPLVPLVDCLAEHRVSQGGRAMSCKMMTAVSCTNHMTSPGNEDDMGKCSV